MDEARVRGDWRHICVLGSGGFGQVDLWQNRINQEQIAVKKCKFQLPSHLSDRQRERWNSEVDIMKSLNHPNIVAYKELPDDLRAIPNPTGLPILSMEYCGRGNLRKFLAQTKNLRGCEETDVRCILSDVAVAIEYLHAKNITHRDIKPENIVIRQCDHRPNRQIYKVIDLGYAKELDTIASFVGTLPYLAPEIFYTQPYNNRVDYWSFGILAYEIVTGVHPFLPNKIPIERFNYVKEKSDQHIAISISRDGRLKFSNEIILCNRLSAPFKRHLENWLKLLLAYDRNKRGFRDGELVNVFDELRTLLNRKMLRVFSVYNYGGFVYEITPDTRLSDVKALIERDTSIPCESQLFVADKETMVMDEAMNINDFCQTHPGKTLYVFKKGSDFEERTVSLSAQVQLLLNSPRIHNEDVLRSLYSHALFFIREEKDLIEQFDAALMLQLEHTMFSFAQIKQIFSRTRTNMVKLNNRIECRRDHDEWRNRAEWPHENGQYLDCLRNSRRLLQQAKELAENVNSFTGKFLVVLGSERITHCVDDLRKELVSIEVDMTLKYNNAMTLYQRISDSDMSSNEMVQILSNVLEIPYTKIFNNEKLKQYMRSVLKIQRMLQKLYVWCNSMDGEITRVTSSLDDCEIRKSEILQNIRIRLPDDREEERTEIEELLRQNQKLRYQIQDISAQGSAYLRNVTREMLHFWNGVALVNNER